MAAGSEEKVLSYHDSLLRNNDLLLLDGPHWLNDKLIGFAFEYFEYERFKRIADKVAFIGAEVTQCIKLSNDSEVGMFIEPLNLPQKDYVFMAVNNNQAQMTTGGTHWSLLVYNRPEGKFSHYDSVGSSNQSPAMSLSCKLHPFLTAAGDLTLVAEECPQQENGESRYL
ncbi:sentrin-specific protease 8-like [Asterias rubens]|uniref:sentrin-specific protease 8-like n=1 Tax=Asterias rubens TaxID=7604 RepID=UPI0014554FE4|nr:sentrin-specific protease 8-like [Asterias rubens]